MIDTPADAILFVGRVGRWVIGLRARPLIVWKWPRIAPSNCSWSAAIVHGLRVTIVIVKGPGR